MSNPNWFLRMAGGLENFIGRHPRLLSMQNWMSAHPKSTLGLGLGVPLGALGLKRFLWGPREGYALDPDDIESYGGMWEQLKGLAKAHPWKTTGASLGLAGLPLGLWGLRQYIRKRRGYALDPYEEALLSYGEPDDDDDDDDGDDGEDAYALDDIPEMYAEAPAAAAAAAAPGYWQQLKQMFKTRPWKASATALGMAGAPVGAAYLIDYLRRRRHHEYELDDIPEMYAEAPAAAAAAAAPGYWQQLKQLFKTRPWKASALGLGMAGVPVGTALLIDYLRRRRRGYALDDIPEMYAEGAAAVPGMWQQLKAMAKAHPWKAGATGLGLMGLPLGTALLINYLRRRRRGYALDDLPEMYAEAAAASPGMWQRLKTMLREHPWKTGGIGLGLAGIPVGTAATIAAIRRHRKRKGYALDDLPELYAEAAAAPGMWQQLKAMAKAHPWKTGASGLGLAGLPLGAALLINYLRRRRRGYSLDDIPEMYADEVQRQAGMQNPTAQFDPAGLPTGQEGMSQVVSQIDPSLMGADYDEETGLESDPGEPDNTFIEPVDREGSDQFAYAGEDPVLYDLQREVGQLKAANALLQASRQYEELKNYLLEQKRGGAPVGDIEQTVEYLMSQTPDQVEQFKEMLESAPKVLTTRMTYDTPINDNTVSFDLQDYETNKEIYSRLGVRPEDLQFARFLRSNQSPNEQ